MLHNARPFYLTRCSIKGMAAMQGIDIYTSKAGRQKTTTRATGQTKFHGNGPGHVTIMGTKGQLVWPKGGKQMLPHRPAPANGRHSGRSPEQSYSNLKGTVNSTHNAKRLKWRQKHCKTCGGFCTPPAPETGPPSCDGGPVPTRRADTMFRAVLQ